MTQAFWSPRYSPSQASCSGRGASDQVKHESNTSRTRPTSQSAHALNFRKSPMSKRISKLISALVIACALSSYVPLAAAQNSSGCEAEAERIEHDYAELVDDYAEALSEAERAGASCTAGLAASDAVKKTLDVRLHDYEEAFADERGLRAAAEERARAARATRWAYAGGGAAVATALAIVLAVIF